MRTPRSELLPVLVPELMLMPVLRPEAMPVLIPTAMPVRPPIGLRMALPRLASLFPGKLFRPRSTRRGFACGAYQDGVVRPRPTAFMMARGKHPRRTSRAFLMPSSARSARVVASEIIARNGARFMSRSLCFLASA